MREQSKLAKDAGAEEFKLTGGKCKYKIRSRYGILLDYISHRILLIEYFYNSAFLPHVFHFLFLASVPTENLKLNESFCTWMDKHANFRTICEEGKGMEIEKQSR